MIYYSPFGGGIFRAYLMKNGFTEPENRSLRPPEQLMQRFEATPQGQDLR